MGMNKGVCVRVCVCASGVEFFSLVGWIWLKQYLLCEDLAQVILTDDPWCKRM